jgi:hypothetical protein
MNVHADEQITKLNMLMHRYTQRQAAEHPASSRTPGKQPDGEGSPTGQNDRQGKNLTGQLRILAGHKTGHCQ